MVWIVFLGVGTAAKKGSHFAVEVFVKSLPLKAQKAFSILRLAIVSGFCFVVIKIATNVMKAQMVMEQISPGLRIPMWIPYLAVPVGCSLMVLRSIQHMVVEIRSNKDKTEKEVQ